MPNTGTSICCARNTTQQEGVFKIFHRDYSLRGKSLIAVIKEVFKGRSEKA